MEFIVGLIMGTIATFIAFEIALNYILKAGTLKVCIPDEFDESPYLYVDLDRPINYICKKKCVLFMVDIRNINSHK